jgi:hypothetical protein
MDTIIPNNPENQTQPSQAGVVRNPNGGYHIHVKLKERDRVIDRPVRADSLAPLDAPRLAEMCVFEDCVLLSVEEGGSIIIHVSDPQVRGSVVYFYHPNGILWRAVAIEQLNPGWVFSTYYFRGDLRELDVHMRQVRSRPARPSWQRRPTFWATGGWQAGVVCVPSGLVERVRVWQHSSWPEPQPVTPDDEHIKRLEQGYPADVQCLLALQAQGVDKVTYQIGGVHLVLSYTERLGLVDVVNRYCPRQGNLSEGTVITVLVINRLLAPCALSDVAGWVTNTGLHLLLGIVDPAELNYDRLADALLAVYPHWQAIATQLTLRAVEQFGLKVETIHYDLTSVFSP